MREDEENNTQEGLVDKLSGGSYHDVDCDSSLPRRHDPSLVYSFYLECVRSQGIEVQGLQYS